MHRTHRMSRTALWFVILSLTAGGLVTVAARAGNDGAFPLRQQPEPPGVQPEGQPPGVKPEGQPGGQPSGAAQPGPAVLGGRPVIISISATQPLQRQDKKEIKRFANPKANVADVQPKPGDPYAVLVTGKAAGKTRISLFDADGNEEVYDVIVQYDVDYLQLLLQRA